MLSFENTSPKPRLEIRNLIFPVSCVSLASLVEKYSVRIRTQLFGEEVAFSLDT